MSVFQKGFESMVGGMQVVDDLPRTVFRESLVIGIVTRLTVQSLDQSPKDFQN